MNRLGSLSNYFASGTARFVGLFVLAAVLAAIAYGPLERYLMSRLAEEGNARLRITVEGLGSTITSVQPLPKLIAERPILVDLLRDPTNSGLVPFVNEQMRLTAFSLGVSDVFLMDLAGTTIAASSYREEWSFVGENFSYRPYFQQAVEGGLGQFFAKGAVSGERGYFIAAPVLHNTRILGVIVVKLSVGPFEEAWSGGVGEVIVTDLSGVIFMSSRPDWRFRTLGNLAPRDIARIEATRQYPIDEVVPLEFSAETVGQDLDLYRIDDESLLVAQETIHEAGLRVIALTPARPARNQTLIILTIVGLVFLAAVLAWQIFLDRKARGLERQRDAERAKEDLELRVEQRTQDLAVANKRLLSEIDERRATEARLRTTQTELIQAGKLAALGQMSAALSHEINQPLAAVKSYADNAATFLDRDRISEARENVGRISDMADRMAKISSHLRNFARRPQEGVEAVEVRSIVDDAVALMEARIKKLGAKVMRLQPDNQVWAQGGRLRLQQVVVNLISNALDAMSELAEPQLEIEIVDAERVSIVVRDQGPGLSDEAEEKLFDPFFTTKAPGLGLGLGLSISYNIIEDFGGRLSAENRSEKGAAFTVSLAPAVRASTEAAE